MRVGRELLPGIFLACVLQLTEPIDWRSHAKGREEHRRRNGFSMCGPWRKSILLPPIALVTNVIGYSSLLDSLARVLAAKCIQMSRNVYVCIRMSRQFQFFGTLFLRLTEQVVAVPEGYQEDVLGAFRSVSADRFHLQVFFGREQWLLSSCASNVHSVGPPCRPTRGTYSIQAASRGLVPSRCNYPGLGRPKSTQVDVSRRKSTGFLFFWTFFLISQMVPPADSGSLTRSFTIGCNCLGLGRVATGYVGVFPFCRSLQA